MKERTIRAAALASASIPAIALWLGAGFAPAWAACDPAAANGVTAVCSGITTNQNDPNGYGTGTENDVTVNVLSGASVVGTNVGISLNSNAVIDNQGFIEGGVYGIGGAIIESLDNRGSIWGGVNGIEANTIDSLVNSGSISGDNFGIAANTIQSLVNSGSMTGGFTGVTALAIGSLVNSGSIEGSGVMSAGIAGTIGSLVNRGSISGGIGVVGSIESLVNSGSITGGFIGVNGSFSGSFVNSGSITGSFTGVGAIAIESLVNSGSITGGTNGINVGTIGSLVNRGSISGGTNGVGFGSIGSLVNSGSIAGGNFGIDASFIGLVNSGSITGGNVGVNANTIESLVNRGSITGGSFGAVALANIQRLVNRGSITGGNFGVAATGIESLVNSGLISGGAFAIIESGSADTTLTLLPGSVLIDQVFLGGGVNTLNVGKGLSMATTFVGSAPEIGRMAVPYVVNGTQVVTADTTNLASHSTMLADLAGGIFSTVENRLDHLRGGVSSFAQPMFTAYAGSAGTGPFASFGADNANADRSRGLWLQAFGALRRQDGAGFAVGSEQRLGGFVSGIDTAPSGTSRAGVFFGASFSSSEADYNAGRNEADSFFGGAYASTTWTETFIDLAFTAGYSAFDQNRRIANNFVPGGIENAKADYNGWFVSPEVRFSRPFALGGQPLVPSLTLRYAGLFLDGFSESGVTAGALSVSSRDIHLGIARAALSLPLSWTYADGAEARWIFTGGVEGRTQFGDRNVAGALVGQGIAFDPGGKRSTAGLFASARVELASPSGYTIYALGEGIAEQDGSYQLSGKAGLRVRY